MPAKLTTAQFIEKARAVHGPLYDYSQVVYHDSKSKVAITCLAHGVFYQSPNCHLSGQNCPSCSINTYKINNTVCATSFIERAIKVHGNIYDYKNTIYIDATTLVEIRCAVHGLFKQKPAKHLRGHGCGKCGNSRLTSLSAKNTGSFIEHARKRHGDFYDYSQVQYVNARTKIVIVCPNHGPFEQLPGHHTAKAGCPMCMRDVRRCVKNSWMAKQRGRQAIFYIVELEGEGEKFYKTGITYNIKKRFESGEKSYKVSVMFKYASLDSGLIYDLEDEVLNKFKHLRYRPAKLFSGHTECFFDVSPIIMLLNGRFNS
ncbi:GIY-YIG nuclease family protein [Hymenobacter metallilatus]|uniref:GIY-YIG nuclease family protein n=1 Tax=Hymenobacter metallilatus TaxID=2493666 RepID=A0A428JCJ7_9BACT|nr:GIY-YIG nuclease family protein [Hymenobacter metallilatus]RSK29847.1 GIY-YIG nuclease family protein [Hymenobacter metallilatus]